MVGMLMGLATRLPPIGTMNRQSEEPKPLYGDGHPLAALSITIEANHKGVPVLWLELMYSWINQFTVAGISSLERGEQRRHLHLQTTVVVRIPHDTIAATAVSNHLKQWFDIWTNTGMHVAVVLLNEQGHNFMYMVSNT